MLSSIPISCLFLYLSQLKDLLFVFFQPSSGIRAKQLVQIPKANRLLQAFLRYLNPVVSEPSSGFRYQKFFGLYERSLGMRSN